MEAKCDAGKFKPPEEIGLTLPHNLLQLPHISQIFVKIAKEENASRQLRTTVQRCKGVPKLMLLGQGVQSCLGNSFSVDVMIHAREWKFVYCSIDTCFAMRLKITASHYFYTRVWCDQF